MANVNWKEMLGWNEEQLDELRLTGFSYLREGHYKKALIFYEALAVLNPANAYDIQTLGALYLEIGDTEKALQTLEKALTLDPIHEPSKLNKVKALLTLQRREEALTLARTLLTSQIASIANDSAALVEAYS